MHRLLQCVLLIAVVKIAAQNTQVTPASISPTPYPISVAGELPGYVLGPDDQLSIWVADSADLSAKPVNIDTSGYITLPLIGRERAAGLTTQQLETRVSADLRRYYVEPHVAISVSEFRSQPVSVIGAINQPGVHQLRGRKRLIEVLSMAGGIRNDAGYTVKITRGMEWGPIPLPTAKEDVSGQFSVAEVEIKDIMTASNPEENILIKPNDVISVPRGELVYVVGEVAKAGGFVLSEQEKMSVLQALSLAGGLTSAAAPKNGRILRQTKPGAQRTEIRVNVNEILLTKAKDVPLQSEDILFIPNSVPKKITSRIAETALNTATGVIIFRHP